MEPLIEIEEPDYIELVAVLPAQRAEDPTTKKPAATYGYSALAIGVAVAGIYLYGKKR